jgi:hypothetical protein
MPAPIIEFIDVNVLVGGVSVDKFSFRSLMGVFTFAGASRQFGPYFSQQEVIDAALGSAAAEAWAGIVFSQDDGVDQVLIGRRDAGDANWTATMDAIEAEDSTSWYITNIESRADADINEVALWTESRAKIFVGQSDDLAGLVAFTAWNAAGYNRSAGIYHATDGEYLDAAWSSSGGGLNLDAEDGVGIWAYRALEGVPFDPVTGAEATSIYAVDANLYGRNKGVSFTSKGTMASGRFMDVTTTVDWLTARIEEAAIALFVGTPTKVPYTNAGINTVVAALQDVLNAGVTYGHFSPDIPPVIKAPDVRDVSEQDKIDRVLTLQAEAVFAGAVQKVIFNINLTFA